MSLDAYARAISDPTDPDFAAYLTRLNAAGLRKVDALRTLARLLKDCGKTFPVRTLPEERRQFMAVIAWGVENAGLPAQLDALRLLLDYLCPGWIKEDPALLGPPIDREAPAYYAWRAAVLKRDRRKCRACQAKDKLHAHHIIPWASSIAGRVDVNNGVTLCVKCHRLQHQDMQAQIWH